MLEQEKQVLVEERNKMNIYMSSMMVALDAKIKSPAGAPVASEASGIAFTKETGEALNTSHGSVAMIGDLDAKITETENEIQARISKREFSSLVSLEARKRELQCQKRDMELCGDTKAPAPFPSEIAPSSIIGSTAGHQDQAMLDVESACTRYLGQFFNHIRLRLAII